MPQMFRQCFSTIRNWASNYVSFSIGALFLSGLILSNSFLEISFKGFLIWYLEEVWEKPSIRKAAAFANVFDGIISFSYIVAHHIAHDHIGCYRQIITTVPCLILGLLSLWLCNLLLSQDRRNQLLYLGLVSSTIGIAGKESSLNPFLFYQFYLQMVDNNQLSEGQQISEDIAEGRANLWNNAAKFIGMFISWAFVSGLDWDHTFMIIFIVVTVAYLLFCCGSCYYKREDPTTKTAASRMMQAKRLLKLISLSLAFIPYSLVEASGNTLFIVQSFGLDSSINPRITLGSFNRIPITSLYLFQTLISSIVSISSNFLIRKFWSSEETMKHRAGFVRIGIGMLFAFGSCLSAWLVEIRRLKLINELRIADDEVIPMKILLLAPQFGLLGIANGFAGEGMWDFFRDRIPQSMWFFLFPLTQGMLGIGRFLSAFSISLAQDWIGDTVNESHLDKYFRMLAILNIAIVVVYIFLSYRCDWNITEGHNESDTPMEEVGGRVGN